MVFEWVYNKRAYEVSVWLEFRRVLFRSLGQRLRRQVACLADGTAREERRDHRVLERRHLAEQIVELEDEADLMTSVADEPRFAPAEDVLALDRKSVR